MNTHSFNTKIAEELGLEESLILQHFYYWHQRNTGNNKNLINGHYWTYNSVEGFSSIFTYISTYKIRAVLKKLKKEGYIIRGNHNKKKYDRTSWYALTEKGLAIFENQHFHLSKSTNAFVEIDRPIPESSTDSNTNSNTNTKSSSNFDFENSFWNPYDKKVNRAKCLKKWKSLKDEQREQIKEHIPKYVQSTPDKKYRKNPLTYLNNESWEDEILPNLGKTENETQNPRKEISIFSCPNHRDIRVKIPSDSFSFCPFCRSTMVSIDEIEYNDLINTSGKYNG